MDQYNIINIIFFQKEFKLIMCFNLIEKSNVCVMCYTWEIAPDPKKKKKCT